MREWHIGVAKRQFQSKDFSERKKFTEQKTSRKNEVYKRLKSR